MLNSINLDDKSYEDLMVEALSKIPLYCQEWTNFNRSDPGITLLQNLTAFNLLQQSTINVVTEDIQRKLLALLGHTARENQAATLLLQAPAAAAGVLPAQTQFRLGGLCFETEGETPLPQWRLKEVYAQQSGVYQELGYLLSTSSAAADPFGPAPQPGNALYCILEGAPPLDAPLRLWAQVPESIDRNPFPAQGGPSFARTRWQYYTAQGWSDAACVDETRGFLTSGAITLTLSGEDCVPFLDTPIQGCALRCLLEEADYDQPPRLQGLAAGLFPVRQWETRSQCYVFSGDVPIHLKTPLALLGNLFVYCREEVGGPYRRYSTYTGIHQHGRFFLREDHPDEITLTFDAQRFGAGPCADPEAVRVICFDDEMVHHRDLGLVYGYEDQEVPLDLVEHVLPQRFSLLVQAPGADGDTEYFFVPPGNTDPESLCYRVDHREGRLHILHPGIGADYRLFLGDCCVTRGAEGNIHAGGSLSFGDGSSPLHFLAPGPGRDGTTYETIDALRAHFVADLRHPSTAVRASDYETLVLETPALCIHKVRAESVTGENLVHIAVKPHGRSGHPTLSPLYLQQITHWLEPRRMLTTRVELLQPRYIPVDVRAVAYVKNYFSNAAAELETLLRRLLDYVNGPQPFGCRVRFNDIYQSILALPCVETVEELRFLTPPRSGVRVEGADLLPDQRTLFYPGNIQVELLTHTAGSTT